MPNELEDSENSHPISNTIQRCSLALLGEWWCVPEDCAPQALIDVIVQKSAAPTSDPVLIKDRLYGGFTCDDPHKRHVYHCLGEYTYLGINVPLTAGDRQSTWEEILEANADEPFSGGGPFTEDAPVPSRDSDHASLDEWKAHVDALLEEIDTHGTKDRE